MKTWPFIRNPGVRQLKIVRIREIDLKVRYLTNFNPHSVRLKRPLRRKLRMRCFFDVPKVKESSFFNPTSLTPHQIFDAHLLETNDFSPFRFHFSVGFIPTSWFESDDFIAYSNEWDWREKTMFIHTNQPLITSFYIKKVPIFRRISDESALIRTFLRNGRVRG